MLFQRTLLFLFSTSLILSCQPGSNDAPLAATADTRFSANAAFAVQTQVVSECTFNGSTLLTGSSVTAYQNSSVPYGSACISEVRSCNIGFLSGSYNYGTCAVNTPASCLFNGQTIAHGISIEAYPGSSVDLGAECIFEMRTCNNGVLSGSNQFASCSINLPASCLFNGQTIISGQSANAYLNSSVPFGQLCSAETRYCVNGALSGSNQYASCVVDQPASCLFNGQTLSDGQSVSAYLNSAVGFGGTCQAEVRTCANGILSGANQFASCVVDQPASCLFNGQTIVHGSSVTGYLKSNSSFGELCDAQERFCNNGQLAGSYQFASCSIDQPASCLFNGQTIANGSSVTAFASSTVNCGSLCKSESRTCSNGILSGSNNFSGCAVGSPKSCLFNGQTIASGQTVTGYLSASVSNGQQCSSEVKTCANGVLSGTYTNASCIVISSKDDDDRDDQKEKYCHKNRVEKKQCNDNDDKDKSEKDGKNNQHSDKGSTLNWFEEKDTEHFDCGLHLGWYKEKKKVKTKYNERELEDKNHKKDK